MSFALTESMLLPTQNLEAYKQAVQRFPLLELEEERRLAKQLREHDDLEAAWRLVTSHLRVVVKISRAYASYGLAQGDLIQEGNVGLMKAVKRFDPDVGVRLVSFAIHWIRAEIHEYILKNWRVVKVATTKAQRKLFFNLRSAKKRLGWLKQNEADAIAEDLGVGAADVVEMERRLAARDEAFDMPGDHNEVYTPAAYLQDSRYEPARMVENEEWEDDAHSRIQAGLATLDERSQTIVRRRWIDEPKATLHDLAAEYKVSAERIRQIEVAALKKLRSQFN